jgi:hypothetical protein
VLECGDTQHALENDIRLTHHPGYSVAVNWATVAGGSATPGEDYEPSSGTVVFELGVTHKPVHVPVYNDNLVEPDETVELQLSNPVGAQVDDPNFTGTIYDDDPGSPCVFVDGFESGNTGAWIVP